MGKQLLINVRGITIISAHDESHYPSKSSVSTRMGHFNGKIDNETVLMTSGDSD